MTLLIESTNTVKQQIIAEIGLTHEGSLGSAMALVESSVNAGADIIKFQCHLAEAESSQLEEFRVRFSLQDNSRTEYWRRTSFSEEQWRILINYTRELGKKFAVSVFSIAAAEMMIRLGVRAIKIGSGDLENEEFHEFFCDWEGELFLSSGMSSRKSIDQALRKYIKHVERGSISLFQCTSEYPTKLSRIGINSLREFQNKYNIPIGLSDHSTGISASIFALSLNANYVEKHVTFSKQAFGPDIATSITFEELSALSKYRDDLKELRITLDKDDAADDLKNLRQLFGRSLGLKNNLPDGHILHEGDFCLRKPAGGLSWDMRKLFLGKPLQIPYKTSELLDLSYIQELGKE